MFHLVSASDIDITSPETLAHLETLRYIQINSSIVPYMSPEAFAAARGASGAPDVLEASDARNHFQFSGEYGVDLMAEVARYALVAGAVARQHDFDVIHVHDWLTYPAGIVAKRVKGCPLVAHVHATEFDRSGDAINADVFAVEREGMHAADAVITVSQLTRQTVIDRYGIPAEKITVVHNGLLQTTPRAAANGRDSRGDPIVTFLGRVTFQKGPEYFLEAARNVLQRFPDVHFVMAGNGDMLRRMIVRAAQLRISSRVHFTGFLRGEETERLFALSDVFVMPSVSEPFGLAALEAIRSGVPVIISKQSGVGEVLHNVFKVDFWDIDALSNAICGLLQFGALSATLVREGRKEIQSLTWDNAARRVHEVYRRLVPVSA